MYHVTDVLSMLIDYSGIPAATLEQAQHLGIETHRYALAAIVDPNLTFDSADPAVNESAEKVQSWFVQNVVEVYCVEHRFSWQKLGLTGRVDLIARIRGDRHWSLIDLKRVHHVSPLTALQTAAYQAGVTNCFRVKPRRRFALHIPKDGPCKAIEFIKDGDWATFMHAFALYKELLACGFLKPPAERAA